MKSEVFQAETGNRPAKFGLGRDLHSANGNKPCQKRVRKI